MSRCRKNSVVGAMGTAQSISREESMADRLINNGTANDGKMGLEALALSP